MSHHVENELKFTLDGLVSNVWIFSILFILAEKNLLQDLCRPMKLLELMKRLGLNEAVLNNMLDVLIEQGAMTREGDAVVFSKAIRDLIESKGLENILLTLKLTQGKSSAFVSDVCGNTWKHGWYYQDETLLQAQGDSSEIVVTELFSQVPELTDKLKKPGCQLVDIGAGVGRISLKFCELYPEVRVVGVEPADIPYTLAKKNISNSAYSDRIELRKIFAADILEENAFDIIWFPQGFLTDHAVYQISLDVIYRALKPGGLLLSATVEDEKNKVTLVKFVFSLSSATHRTPVFLRDSFSKAGFEDIRLLPASSAIVPIVASKPR